MKIEDKTLTFQPQKMFKIKEGKSKKIPIRYIVENCKLDMFMEIIYMKRIIINELVEIQRLKGEWMCEVSARKMTFTK